jgi:hypothetical protein
MIEPTTNYFAHLDQGEMSTSAGLEPMLDHATAEERLARMLASSLARTMCTTTSPESEFRAAMLKRAAELSQLSSYMQQLAGGGADAPIAPPELPRSFTFQEQAALFNAVEQNIPAGVPATVTSAGLRRSRSLLSIDEPCWEPSEKRISRRSVSSTSWGSTCSLWSILESSDYLQSIVATSAWCLYKAKLIKVHAGLAERFMLMIIMRQHSLIWAEHGASKYECDGHMVLYQVHPDSRQEPALDLQSIWSWEPWLGHLGMGFRWGVCFGSTEGSVDPHYFDDGSVTVQLLPHTSRVV